MSSECIQEVTELSLVYMCALCKNKYLPTHWKRRKLFNCVFFGNLIVFIYSLNQKRIWKSVSIRQIQQPEQDSEKWHLIANWNSKWPWAGMLTG